MTRRKGLTETSRFNRDQRLGRGNPLQLRRGSAETARGPAEPRGVGRVCWGGDSLPGAASCVAGRRRGARRLLGAVLGSPRHRTGWGAEVRPEEGCWGGWGLQRLTDEDRPRGLRLFSLEKRRLSGD